MANTTNTTNTNPNINNIDLIKNIIDGVANNNQGLVVPAYIAISKLIVIEQYYLVKGLKIALQDTFYTSIKMAPTQGRNICILLLSDIYGDQQANIEAAQDGMGNIDAYVAAIKAL